MSTDRPTNIVSFSQTYPPELAAMIPPQFNAPDSISTVPLPDNNSHAFDPADINKKDLWPQRLINLKDIPVELWWASAGKSLIINRAGEPSAGDYNIQFAYPDRLETSRDFSISGDGTADPVSFDGQGDVDLVLRDVKATSLEARDFSLSGDIVATAVSFDGTANVVLQTTYNAVIPDEFLPAWISNSFTALSQRIDNLQLVMAIRTDVISSGAGFTLNAGHKDKYIRIVNSGVVTVPPGQFVKNDVVYIRAAAGPVTISPGAGVTINAPFGQNHTLPGTGATVAIICVATGVFDLIGSTQYV